MTRRGGRRKRGSYDRQMKARTIEFFVFIGILLVGTAFLGIMAVQSSNTAPPHAGVSIASGQSGYTVVQVNSMGQADSVEIYVNGQKTATLKHAGASYRIRETKDDSKRVVIISDNGGQRILLRSLYV